jgi:hypothetical protein
MSNIFKRRGSQYLTGAAALRYRMPAMADFPAAEIAQWQSSSLARCGLRVRIPLSDSNHPCTGLYSR